jgi:hypothetical protein
MTVNNEVSIGFALTGGNLERIRVPMGLLKENNGFVFLNDKEGNFYSIKPRRSDISIPMTSQD